MVLKVITVGIFVVMKNITVIQCLLKFMLIVMRGDGDEWVEYWSIDDKGRIHSEDVIYENYEEFLREW